MDAPTGLLLSDDMIFTSRITGTARDLGLMLKQLRSMDNVLAEAQQRPPTCVIVDLANPGAVRPCRMSSPMARTLTLLDFARHERRDAISSWRGANSSKICRENYSFG